MLASELKVWRDTYILVNDIIQLQKNYPKQYKYSVGQKMVNVALELFEYIQLANIYYNNRTKHLEGFIVKFELLKILIRISVDNKLISVGQHAKITFKKLNEIDNVKDLMPSVNSYLGMMQHYSCYNIKKELIDGLNHNVYEQAYFGTHINKMILR